MREQVGIDRRWNWLVGFVTGDVAASALAQGGSPAAPRCGRRLGSANRAAHDNRREVGRLSPPSDTPWIALLGGIGAAICVFFFAGRT